MTSLKTECLSTIARPVALIIATSNYSIASTKIIDFTLSIYPSVSLDCPPTRASVYDY